MWLLGAAIGMYIESFLYTAFFFVVDLNLWDDV